MATIEKRSDANPERGEQEYGDVKFADPTNKKYPIDTEEHVRAAWSYIHQQRNRDEYSAKDLKTIEDRIKKAGQKYGIDFESN